MKLSHPLRDVCGLLLGLGLLMVMCGLQALAITGIYVLVKGDGQQFVVFELTVLLTGVALLCAGGLLGERLVRKWL